MNNPVKTNTFLSTKQLVLIGLITAITCILAPLSIPLPFSPVPVSLTNLVLFISVYLLGAKASTISCFIYLCLGAVGLPVFSGFSGGFGKIAGPTGGYLIGFLFLTLIAGMILERNPKSKLYAITGMLLGMIVTYLFGTLWLCKLLKVSFLQGLTIGVIPYLIFDAAKIAIACLIGPTLSKRINKI